MSNLLKQFMSEVLNTILIQLILMSDLMVLNTYMIDITHVLSLHVGDH